MKYVDAKQMMRTATKLGALSVDLLKNDQYSGTTWGVAITWPGREADRFWTAHIPTVPTKQEGS